MAKRGKRRLAALLCATALLVCTLSGCWRPAGRGELIDWFYENYTDAPLTVAREPEVNVDGDDVYAACLKAAPELEFHIWSRRVYVGEHSEYRNTTDFPKVYGEFYFRQYQADRLLQYWRAADESDTSFVLEALYSTPAELDAALGELMELNTFLMEQEPAVRGNYHLNFRSPLCAPGQYAFSLGSETLRPGDLETPEAAEGKHRDLLAELAAWCSFYGLNLEWFSEEEMEQALAYTQTEDYGGQSVYIGAWNIADPEKGDLRIPLVAPNARSFSFAQLYRLLQALGWETLEGSETDFTFLGADGCTYALSYALWEDEDGNLVNRCTKDGVSMDINDGCFSSYSLLTDMTGVVLPGQSGTTYRGPDSDGIAHLPAGPGL